MWCYLNDQTHQLLSLVVRGQPTSNNYIPRLPVDIPHDGVNTQRRIPHLPHNNQHQSPHLAERTYQNTIIHVCVHHFRQLFPYLLHQWDIRPPHEQVRAFLAFVRDGAHGVDDGDRWGPVGAYQDVRHSEVVAMRLGKRLTVVEVDI